MESAKEIRVFLHFRKSAPHHPYGTSAGPIAFHDFCYKQKRVPTSFLLFQTAVEFAGNGLLVEMLTNEDQFLHAVAVAVVPIALQARVLLLEETQLVFGHRGVPLASLTNAHLLAGLLEHVAHIGFVVEPADAFRPNNAFRPAAGYKLIEQSKVQSGATIVDIRADAIFLSLTLIMMMVVVVMVGAPLRLPRGGGMMVVLVLIVIVVMMMVLMLVIVIIVVMMVLMMLVIVVIVVIIFMMILDFVDPSS